MQNKAIPVQTLVKRIPLSDRELALRLGKSIPTVWRWRTGIHTDIRIDDYFTLLAVADEYSRRDGTAA